MKIAEDSPPGLSVLDGSFAQNSISVFRQAKMKRAARVANAVPLMAGWQLPLRFSLSKESFGPFT
jgi:hypothetical protein